MLGCIRTRPGIEITFVYVEVSNRWLRKDKYFVVVFMFQ